MEMRVSMAVAVAEVAVALATIGKPYYMEGLVYN